MQTTSNTAFPGAADLDTEIEVTKKPQQTLGRKAQRKPKKQAAGSSVPSKDTVSDGEFTSATESDASAPNSRASSRTSSPGPQRPTALAPRREVAAPAPNAVAAPPMYAAPSMAPMAPMAANQLVPPTMAPMVANQRMAPMVANQQLSPMMTNQLLLAADQAATQQALTNLALAAAAANLQQLLAAPAAPAPMATPMAAPMPAPAASAAPAPLRPPPGLSPPRRSQQPGVNTYGPAAAAAPAAAPQAQQQPQRQQAQPLFPPTLEPGYTRSIRRMQPGRGLERGAAAQPAAARPVGLTSSKQTSKETKATSDLPWRKDAQQKQQGESLALVKATKQGKAKAKAAPAPEPVVEEPPSKRLDQEDEGNDEIDVSNLSPADAALMQAVAICDTEGVEKAVAAGGNVDLTTSGGKPLIFYALMRAKDAGIVKILLKAGASVHHADVVGNRVMHLWARAKRARDDLLEVGEALIEAGADLDAQRKDGMTAIHLLAGGHNTHRDWLDFHKATLLVRHGAAPDVVAPCGRQPVDMLKPNQRAATARFQTLLTECAGYCTALPTCNQPACRWCVGARQLSL